MNITKGLTSLAMAMAFLSCGDDNPSSVKEDDRYVISKVYDVGNNNNATDIRVNLEFKIGTSLSDIEEARLVVVKGSTKPTKDQIEALSPDDSFLIPLSSAQKQVAKPSEALNDIMGNAITNGNYHAYVAILGKDNSITFSRGIEFTLADKPIYAGDYIGTWEDLGPPGPAKFPMSLSIANDYSGKMFYANANFRPFGSGTQDATTTMTVDGTVISSFNLNQLIGDYMGGCSASKTLTGNFEDDLNLVLNTFEWSDCDGTRQVKLKFTRQ